MGATTDHPYVSAVVADGRFVFVSGQTPARNGELVGGAIAQQTEAVIANIAAILDSAGATLDDVVRCGVFLADLDDLPGFNTAYVRAFGSRFPARTLVEVRLPGYAVEIDCIAAVSGR